VSILRPASSAASSTESGFQLPGNLVSIQKYRIVHDLGNKRLAYVVFPAPLGPAMMKMDLGGAACGSLASDISTGYME
jgi:hypothetical protein